MSVECKYGVLVTALDGEGREYSFPLYSNLEKRAQILYQALQISIRTASPVAIDGVAVQLLRVTGPFIL